MSILIYGMKKGKFCHQFSNFTIPPSMKIHKNEVKFKNWICQNFFPENKMDMNLQYKSKGGKSLTLKTLPQQMFRIVTFHVDHTVYTQYYQGGRQDFEIGGAKKIFSRRGFFPLNFGEKFFEARLFSPEFQVIQASKELSRDGQGEVSNNW